MLLLPKFIINFGFMMYTCLGLNILGICLRHDVVSIQNIPSIIVELVNCTWVCSLYAPQISMHGAHLDMFSAGEC